MSDEILYSYVKGKGWIPYTRREYVHAPGNYMARNFVTSDGTPLREWYPPGMAEWPLVEIRNGAFIPGDYIPMGRFYGYLITDVVDASNALGVKITYRGEIGDEINLHTAGEWSGIARNE